MVKVKEQEHWLSDGIFNVQAWLEYLEGKYPSHAKLDWVRSACTLAELAGSERATQTGESCLQEGLAVAEILADLEVDAETLAAAVIYSTFQYAELSLEDVQEQMGKNIARMVIGVQRMNAIGSMQSLKETQAAHQQIDNLRKMLLAMVDDVRVVLIKLAERLHILRTAAALNDSLRRSIAEEVMDIYAPLANRLGIGSIKWEMEDLAFRYLQPEKYKEIAKGLRSRRLDRDKYVSQIVECLESELTQLDIKGVQVYGRSKHIHSIYRKMTRKNLPLSEIYDATAVRVLVEKDEDCYIVLGVVHGLWQPIPKEFDDYITNPKPNGYRSLHTAVIGPEDRHFEVQIRTYQMHDQAELGVAAHWKYKEGGSTQKQAHERKIEWLREVLAWHFDVAKAEGVPHEIQTEFFEDRVYVFTPDGEIVDLPQGSTPLDFAYHIHTGLGHRCRGAKVNGNIVNLVYPLKTGEQVEILAGKQANPSRDWINPHLGYLKSSRARAKVLQWFKSQDFERNCHEGQAALEREWKKLNIKTPSMDDLAVMMNFKKSDDMFAALGRGDLKITQILSKIAQVEQTNLKTKKIARPKALSEKAISDQEDLYIEGIGNLMTRMAQCCNPTQQDDIIGYVTIGRGISIHKKSCPNILHADFSSDNRWVNVSWGRKPEVHYQVDVAIQAYDRQGLLNDITQLLTQEKVNLITLTTKVDKEEHQAHIELSAEVGGLEVLSRLLEKLKQISNVIEVKRT